MSKTFTNKEVFGKLHEEGNSEGAKKGWLSRRGGSTVTRGMRVKANVNSIEKYGNFAAMHRKRKADDIRSQRAKNSQQKNVASNFAMAFGHNRTAKSQKAKSTRVWNGKTSVYSKKRFPGLVAQLRDEK
jgi:uncharacterized protein YdaU (DUF1376 family)